MIGNKIIEAFQMMWGHFPEGVMLVNKDRKIVAVNAAYETAGIKAGMICSQIGAPEMHKGCLANQAISEQTAQYKKINLNDKEIIAFWVPVVGEDRLYLHFNVGTMIE